MEQAATPAGKPLTQPAVLISPGNYFFKTPDSKLPVSQPFLFAITQLATAETTQIIGPESLKQGMAMKAGIKTLLSTTTQILVSFFLMHMYTCGPNMHPQSWL